MNAAWGFLIAAAMMIAGMGIETLASTEAGTHNPPQGEAWNEMVQHLARQS